MLNHVADICAHSVFFSFFLNCPHFSFSLCRTHVPLMYIKSIFLDSVLMITAFPRDPLLFRGVLVTNFDISPDQGTI